MTDDPEQVARELIEAGPSEVPEILTAAWILRLIDEFAVTAADDMPAGERRFHTRFNYHLLAHIWVDMTELWRIEGGQPVPTWPEIQHDTPTPEAEFAAALQVARVWCNARHTE